MQIQNHTTFSPADRQFTLHLSFSSSVSVPGVTQADLRDSPDQLRKANDGAGHTNVRLPTALADRAYTTLHLLRGQQHQPLKQHAHLNLNTLLLKNANHHVTRHSYHKPSTYKKTKKVASAKHDKGCTIFIK